MARDSDTKPIAKRGGMFVSTAKSLSKFGFIVVFSFIINLAIMLLSVKAYGDIGVLTKQLNEWRNIPGVEVLVAWRVIELGLASILGFDGKQDMTTGDI